MIKNLLLKLRQNWLLILFLSILAIIMVVVSILYNQEQTRKTVESFNNQLSTLSNLKAMQITLWRQEVLVDAETIQKDTAFSNDIMLYKDEPENFSYLQEIQERLRSQLLDPNYSSIFLVDNKGNIMIQVGMLDEKPGLELAEIISEADSTHEIQLSDLYTSSSNATRMDMVVPVYHANDENLPAIAFLVYMINPEPILYPLIESLPSNYETIETLLVRKEGDYVLFLNNIKFLDQSKLTLQIPLVNNDVPAVMAANGIVGIVNGEDYRGVPVMASITPVQDSEWRLIAKIDWDEVNEPIRQQLWISIIASLLLLSVAGLTFNLIWRKRSAGISKVLSDTEGKRKELEEKYSTLFNQANDAILLIAEDGYIIEANEKAVNLYGYTRDELLSLTIADLRDVPVRAKIKTDMDHVKTGVSNYFETTHRKKNGDVITVEVSSRFLSLGNKGFYQSLIRDVTQRKEAEDQLRRSELDLKKAQQVSHVGSWHWNVKANKIDRSDEMYQIFGQKKDSEGKGLYEYLKSAVQLEEFSRIMNILETANKTKQLYSFETQITRPDGIQRDIWIEAGEITLDEKGEITAVSGIIQDITEKKAAEREIRKSENLLQRIFDLLPVGLWITDHTGRLIRSNRKVKEIWGKDILVGVENFDVFHGRKLPSREEIKPDDWASVHTIKEGVTIKDEMIEIDAYDGKTKTILNYTTPLFDEKNAIEGSIIVNLDISELRKAEEQLSTQLDELRRWNVATLGRESRIRELKAEINELLQKQGLPPKYESVVSDDLQ